MKKEEERKWTIDTLTGFDTLKLQSLKIDRLIIPDIEDFSEEMFKEHVKLKGKINRPFLLDVDKELLMKKEKMTMKFNLFSGNIELEAGTQS